MVNNNRFVVHRHEICQGQEPAHYDLMLEKGDCLMTFRLERIDKMPCGALKIKDHDLKFLDFEGKVSTGNVRIVDNGNYEIISRTKEKIELIFDGNKLKGSYCLENLEGDNWLLKFIL